MSKKGRFRKKSSSKVRVECDRDLLVTERKEEKITEDSVLPVQETRGDPDTTLSMKKSILFGFTLLGMVIGFLEGYGNLNLINGIINGIVGFFIGFVLGYLPFISFK